MKIQSNGSKPSVEAPERHFTSSVRMAAPFQAEEPGRVGGAYTTFEPGARTAWHTHPAGQTLVVTSGLGRAHREGGPVEQIRPDDVVWFTPGEKHWHGASPDAAVTHVAVVENLDGKNTNWLEKVSAGQDRR